MISRRGFVGASTVAVAGGSLVGGQAIAGASRTPGAPYLHNVYFWLVPDLSDADRTLFESGLRTLVSDIAEVKQYEIGIPAATPVRDVVDHSYDYSLFAWFNSLKDHDVYQAHPVHLNFIDTCSTFWTRVDVRDSQLITA